VSSFAVGAVGFSGDLGLFVIKRLDGDLCLVNEQVELASTDFAETRLDYD